MTASLRRAAIVRTAIALELGLVLLAWALGHIGGVSPFASLRPELAAAGIGVAATVPLLAGLALLVRSRWGPVRRLVEEVERTIVPLFRGCGVTDMVAIALAAGLGEELLFRGAIQPLATLAVGPVAGLVVASALFGLAHLVTRTYALLAALVGLYLGSLLLMTGSLLVPVTVHALYDFVALSYWLGTTDRRRSDTGAVPPARTTDGPDVDRGAPGGRVG